MILKPRVIRRLSLGLNNNSQWLEANDAEFGTERTGHKWDDGTAGLTDCANPSDSAGHEPARDEALSGRDDDRVDRAEK